MIESCEAVALAGCRTSPCSGLDRQVCGGRRGEGKEGGEGERGQAAAMAIRERERESQRE